jgi:hypothetical protein
LEHSVLNLGILLVFQLDYVPSFELERVSSSELDHLPSSGMEVFPISELNYLPSFGKLFLPLHTQNFQSINTLAISVYAQNFVEIQDC